MKLLAICKLLKYKFSLKKTVISKILRNTLNTLRFVSYQQNSLEKKFKLELHTDPGLGVVIDLIDPLTYKVSLNSILFFFTI